MTQAPTIVWFRQNLRLQDNLALQAACHEEGPVIPVFIWSPESEGDWPRGSASKWWLHHSLAALEEAFKEVGSRLILRAGQPQKVLKNLIAETGAVSLFWNRCYEPAIIARDKALKAHFLAEKIEVRSFPGNVLHEPWTIETQGHTPFKVFTPFSRAAMHQEVPAPVGKPRKITAPKSWPKSEKLADWRLLPTIPWDAEFAEHWTPGEAGAHQRLRKFLKSAAMNYASGRDTPGEPGTSRLSPHLHFGEISPRQVWKIVCAHFEEKPQHPHTGEPYLRQILWREFGQHLLYHFPHTPIEPLREEFSRFPWKKMTRQLHAWQKGLTGYPIVDAGMRELWRTGWMHNRVRMIVASFLVKDLLIPWQEGAKWFWDTLVDADLGNNTLGWQWVAGCGADAAPYFRIFNPVSQGERCDSAGDYVRRWVPELSELPERWIHKPWDAPAEVLKKSGVTLGKTYPERIVDHKIARENALAAFQEMQQGRKN